MASVPPELKVKFMQRLKKIKTINYAMQFCDILIEAQKVHEECGDKEENFCKSWQHSDQILVQIKNILKLVPAEELVKNIFKALCADEEELPVKEQLVNCLKSVCQVDPTDYLNELIKHMESTLKLYKCTSLNRHYLIERNGGKINLNTLKISLLAYGNRKNEVFFSEMFWIGISTTLDFSLEEKKEVKESLIEAMPYTVHIIRNSIFNFSRSTAFGLVRASGMQFLRDLLEDYSDDSQTKVLIGDLDDLRATLKDLASYFSPALDCTDCHLVMPNFVMRNIHIVKKEDIPDFSTKKMKLAFDVDDWSDYKEEIYPCDTIVDTLYFLGGQYVPKTHFWWKNYMKDHLEVYPHASSIFISYELISKLINSTCSF